MRASHYVHRLANVEIEILNATRSRFTMSAICWLYYWGTHTGAIDYESMIAPINVIEPPQPDDIFPSTIKGWDNMGMYFNIGGRTEYQNLMYSIA
jgi:hypothetical protein